MSEAEERGDEGKADGYWSKPLPRGQQPDRLPRRTARIWAKKSGQRKRGDSESSGWLVLSGGEVI